MTQDKEITAKLQDLSALYEVTKNLASCLELEDCLKNTVQILAAAKGMKNSTVTIVNPDTGKREAEASWETTEKDIKDDRHNSAEDIISRVISSGEPIIVPHVTEEPLFSDKAELPDNNNTIKHSFLCVPVRTETQTIGALGIDKVYEDGIGEHANADLQFLSILSGIIARTAVRIQKVNNEREKLYNENLKLKRELSEKNGIDGIIGNSSRMQDVYDMIYRVVNSDATVLLRGEAGTGKNLVARILHYNGKRKGQPFVTVNCSAIPENLLENEIFGNEKGLFVDAAGKGRGKLEQAEGGTLFLDEIGRINNSVQSRLLELILKRSYQKPGSKEQTSCNVRLIVASRQDLEQAVADKLFREDLYYRLNVFPVLLPPLRERRTDILLLAEFFMEKFAAAEGKEITRISTSAIDMLSQYHWPGNVRELQNCIERAVKSCDGDTIKNIHLPPSLQTSQSASSADNPLSLAATVENFEKELIIEGLKKCNGNQTRTAKHLGTSLRIINYIIDNKYKI